MNLIDKAGTFHLGSRTVKRIGYGTMQLAGPGVFGPPKDRTGAIAVLRAAIKAGINHIDTSDFYGPHTTNQLIREALHPYRDDLVIVTKIGARRGDDGAWIPAFSVKELTQAVHDNLRNLGLDVLDVVNLRSMFDVHGPAEGSLETPLTALAELQQQGLVRHIGLSNVTPTQIADGRRICEIVCVQNMYNLVHRNDDALIDELAARGTAYVPFFPLGGFTPLQASTLSEVATTLGATPMRVAPSVAAATRAEHPADFGHLIGATLAGEPGSGRAEAAKRIDRQARSDCSQHPKQQSVTSGPTLARNLLSSRLNPETNTLIMPITINGSEAQLPDDPRVSLLDLLRENLHLTGAKKGCNQGACGACTVLVDGERVLSCLTLAVQCEGRSVTSIEGLATGDELHPLQRAFVEHDGFQCGYCTPGQICSAIGMAAELRRGVPSNVTEDLAAESIALSSDELRERMSGNLCRCGAYNGIVDAITETFAETTP